MREPDFEKLREEKIKFLEDHHTIVLATSHDNKVTARTVTYGTEGLDFYFLSWNHHEKILQIKENSNVALVRDKISIKCVAEILGKPLDEKSKNGAEVTKKKHPKEFEEVISILICQKLIYAMCSVRMAAAGNYGKSW